MELKDLKSAWETYSSQEVNKHRLEKETIHELLKNRTKSLVEHIDRNIRIGLGILLVFIAYTILDSVLMTNLPQLIAHQPVEIPHWLTPIDVFSTVLIVTTYLFFVFRYLKIKKSFSVDLQIKDLLKGIIETVRTYRRMFYLAVVILLLSLTVGFAAGFYQGIKMVAESKNISISGLETSQILTSLGVGLLILTPLITILFFLLRWGFNKLYGKYLQTLKETLRELDEPETME